jgi:alkylation response protein AidB-like acyl-CoA dehydrogenase
MVEFELSEEQKMFQKTAHDFAARELRPISLECDRTHVFPPELLKKGHEAGLISYAFPEERLVEKLHRDARGFRLFEGTSEIMRLIVSREMTRK